MPFFLSPHKTKVLRWPPVSRQATGSCATIATASQTRFCSCVLDLFDMSDMILSWVVTPEGAKRVEKVSCWETEAAPRPSLLRGVRQFFWNHLESVSCHFCGQGFWSSVKQGKWCEKSQATAQQSNCSL